MLIRRDKRPDDVHFGYHNGLGGKLEPDEDVVAGMRREIREESGLECREVQLSGTLAIAALRRDGRHIDDEVLVQIWPGRPRDRELLRQP